MLLENKNTELFNSLVKKIDDAPTDEKSEAIMNAMQQMVDEHSETIVNEYRQLNLEVQANKENAEKFGLRTLSKEETKFYDKFKPNMALSADEIAYIPQTTADFIMEDIKTQSDLLRYINIQPTAMQTILVAERSGSAGWGELTATIVDEISAEIKADALSPKKLSGFMLVPTAILDLGAQWVDRYVRAVLQEVIQEALEEAVITGDGSDGPVGLDRQLTGAVDGVHTKRNAVALSSFEPNVYGTALQALTNDGKRKVSEVVLVVNPTDYLSKILGASKQLVNGVWVDAFPLPTTVIQSTYVTAGEAIAFIPGKYSLGLKSMGVEYSDHFKFLDHQRTYRTVAYGNGRLPKENMAVLLDIENLAPYALPVTVKGTVSTKEQA